MGATLRARVAAPFGNDYILRTDSPPDETPLIVPIERKTTTLDPEPMVQSRSEWLNRHRSRIMAGTIVLLLIVAVAEGFLLYLQRRVGREIEAQSSQLLTRFLEGENVETSGDPGVALRLQNVRFKWSDKVFIDTGDMAVRAVPIRGRTVDFDDLDSFLLNIQKSDVLIRPEVLEGMLNESVFNYPDSNVRDLEVTLKEDEGEHFVRVTGNMKLVLWIPFKLRARLLVDTGTNTLVMDVAKVEVLGFIPATAIMKWKPLRLESLIALPPNKSLMVDGNRMMVKPFGLFPPPRINGKIADVAVTADMIRLGFAGEAVEAPGSTAKNYIYLRGGTSQFGRFRMVDTDVLVVDEDESDPFVFSLQRYAELLPKSLIELRNTRSAHVTMPDLSTTPNTGG